MSEIEKEEIIRIVKAMDIPGQKTIASQLESRILIEELNERIARMENSLKHMEECINYGGEHLGI